MAYALSRRIVDSAREHDVEALGSEISTLCICDISEELLGLEAADQTDLLNRIRVTQQGDQSLVDELQAVGYVYEVSANRTILVRRRICVSNVKELRYEVLKEVYASKFSIYPCATKI